MTKFLHSASFHKYAAIGWLIGGGVLTFFAADAVWWVAIMSLYANVVGHLGAYQAARAEEKAEER